MKILSLTFLSFALLCLCVNAEIAEKFKQDIFDIYTNAVSEKKNITGTPVTPENVTYYLFTKNNPVNYTKLDYKNPDIPNKDNERFVFIIHGWTETREKQWYSDLKDAFLSIEDEIYNVIQVDWRDPADQLYAVSSVNTQDVGKIVGDFIIKLHKEKNIPLENIEIVGHSLGGQVAGFVGKKVQNETGNKLPRIIALDPAGPLFNARPDEERLNANDAKVVAVIHTDGGKLGFEASTGTIDFFPNGGSDQPGCTKIDLLDISSIAEPVYCDHHRSYEFFTEAILNPDSFVAKKCSLETKALVIKTRKCEDNDTVTLGDLKTTKTGDYYLETNNEKPFGKKTSAFDISKLIPSL